MKKYLLYFKKKSLTLSIILFVVFLFSFFVSNLYNQNKSYYQASFSVSNVEEFDAQLLLDEDFLNSIKEAGKGKYDGTNVEKMLENDGISYVCDNNNFTITTKSKYYETFFLSSKNNVSTRAKMFIKDSVLKIAGDKCEVTFSDSDNIVILKNSVNRWIVSLISLIGAFIIEIIAMTILFFIKKDKSFTTKVVYDNETTFSHVFFKKYWKEATKPLVKVKDITTLAMLFALMLVSKLIPLPSGFGNLGISFTYLFFSIISMIYGPVYGFVVGVFSDIIGYFLPNSGGGTFNLGYTLQAALTGMIYGLFFFRAKVSFKRVLFARTIVNILMNAIYGSFLFIFVMYFNNTDSMDFNSYLEKVKYYMLLMSLPKNIVYLLPQSILLYYVITLVEPILIKSKLALVPKTIKVSTENDKVCNNNMLNN